MLLLNVLFCRGCLPLSPKSPYGKWSIKYVSMYTYVLALCWPRVPAVDEPVPSVASPNVLKALIPLIMRQPSSAPVADATPGTFHAFEINPRLISAAKVQKIINKPLQCAA